jgi:methionyl-tRNA formyltransferase
MNIVYMGSGEFGIPCLDALKASSHTLSVVVTQPANPCGRGRRIRPTAVAAWAACHDVVCLETANTNAPAQIEMIEACRPDCFVVIACGQKICQDLVMMPPKGAINVHASLLPAYRGAAPINWALVRGETRTGVSIIALADKIDAGDILGQAATDIGPHETAGELHDRLARLSAPLLLDTLAQIEAGTATYTPQDHEQATFAPKLKKADGFLDFTEPAELLARKIRGFWPWPGASAMHVSERTGKSTPVTFALADVARVSCSTSLSPGAFDNNFRIVCGVDALTVLKLKPAGSALMDFKDFVNGWHVCPGDRFVRVAP